MIIFDENLDQFLIDRIIENKFEYLSIKDYRPGLTDREIVDIAKTKGAVIITEDKDFGELVFSYGLEDFSVIFLRYQKQDRNKIINNIFKVLDIFYRDPGHYFFTIAKEKIRINKL